MSVGRRVVGELCWPGGILPQSLEQGFDTGKDIAHFSENNSRATISHYYQVMKNIYSITCGLLTIAERLLLGISILLQSKPSSYGLTFLAIPPDQISKKLQVRPHGVDIFALA